MIDTFLTPKAMKLCFAAHKEQVDKSGLPYVFHPFRLAEQIDEKALERVEKYRKAIVFPET